MARRPHLRFRRELLQALLTAYREAARERGARAPSRGELYQALLDTAVLTEDAEALRWFEAVGPLRDRSAAPVPLRAMLARLRRRHDDQDQPIRLVELARALAGPAARRIPETLPARREETLPVEWDREDALALRPETRPARPAPEPDRHRERPVSFHCSECCPTSQRRRSERKVSTAQEDAEAFLESIGGELTRRDRSRDQAVGRERELDQVIEAMLRMHRPNPILVGPSGVGKSVMLEGLAQRIVEGQVPGRLRRVRVFRLDANLFRAQAGIIGRVEEFLERLVAALATVAPAYLAIDEFHLLAGTGAHKDDPKGAEQYLRDHLARGTLRILGTTTPGEYQRFVAEDRSLESRLVKVVVEEPDLPEARRMVRVAAQRMEEHYQQRVEPALADYATALSFEHPRGAALPLSAVDLLDWGLARAEARGHPAGREDLEEALAERLGCEVAHIRQEGSGRIRLLASRLGETIKGQEQAAADTVAALKPYSAGLRDRNRPAAVLLFAGPTGVGKTETAKQIADALFGSARQLVRVAMADFTDAWASTRLLGSGPGYVGHEKGGWLVRRLRETPSCVLLLDEFDRAHQAVRDVFLEAFDNARLVDSRGLEANLTHTIVILTSNLGATGSRTPGFTRDEVVSARARLLRILKAELSAPLVGRLTAVVPFDALTPGALEQILDLKLARLEARLGLEPGEVELEPELRAAVIERGTGPATGARGLDEALEKLVIRPLAARILEEGRPEKGRKLTLGRAEAGI